MSTSSSGAKTRFVTMRLISILLVLAVQGYTQTANPVKRLRSLRQELKAVAAETGMSVAMFDRGYLGTAPVAFPKHDWNSVEIPGAMKHSWSDEGMVSPDGTLVAFPYWEVNLCPSRKNCNASADRHYFLAVTRTGGSGMRKYPEIVLPSEMCWSHDDTKLAMVAQGENYSHPQLLVLNLDSGNVDVLADGRRIAVTPQCWSPDGKQLVYFSGEKDKDRPGAIRILNTATGESRDLLHDNTTCPKDGFCVSPYPTWSPDGEWIAYFQQKTYWAVHPSGEGRKELFRRPHALSPLQWSPDGRYALYADCCAFMDTWRSCAKSGASACGGGR